MKNTLQFWTLQHLYVILWLADVRTIGDILEVNHVFSILHPEVEKMEQIQNDLGNRVKPLIHKRKELAEIRKTLTQDGKNADDIIDSQDKLDIELKELDKELQGIQSTVPSFEWSPWAIATIREVVPHVFEALWVQHEQLNGYRRISATAEIIQQFEIPVQVSL